MSVKAIVVPDIIRVTVEVGVGKVIYQQGQKRHVAEGTIKVILSFASHESTNKHCCIAQSHYMDLHMLG